MQRFVRQAGLLIVLLQFTYNLLESVVGLCLIMRVMNDTFSHAVQDRQTDPQRPDPQAADAEQALARTLSNLYTQPGHLLRRAHQIAASIFHDELGTLITPVQYAVLRILVENPGIDQVSLAGLVAMDTSTAASVAGRLEERQLLTRNVDPANRRQRRLYLTEQGRALLLKTQEGNQRLHHRLFDGFSPEEEHLFMELLKKLVHINNFQSRAPLAPRKPSL